MYSLILFAFLFVLSIALLLQIEFDVRPFFGLSRRIIDDEADRSIFYFFQLYMYYLLCYWLCLNYLRASRIIGYSLNPEVEDSYYPPRVLLMVGTLLIVLLVVNFTSDAIDGPYSMRPLFLLLTKVFVSAFYFYFTTGFFTTVFSVF